MEAQVDERREGETSLRSRRLSARERHVCLPRASRSFLRPLYFQASARQARERRTDGGWKRSNL